jgi:hypothetical protein
MMTALASRREGTRKAITHNTHHRDNTHTTSTHTRQVGLLHRFGRTVHLISLYHICTTSLSESIENAQSVAGSNLRQIAAAQANAQMALLQPGENAILPGDRVLDFSWSEIQGAAFYRLEVEDSQGKSVLSAVQLPGVNIYRARPRG